MSSEQCVAPCLDGRVPSRSKRTRHALSHTIPFRLETYTCGRDRLIAVILLINSAHVLWVVLGDGGLGGALLWRERGQDCKLDESDDAHDALEQTYAEVPQLDDEECSATLMPLWERK